MAATERQLSSSHPHSCGESRVPRPRLAACLSLIEESPWMLKLREIRKTRTLQKVIGISRSGSPAETRDPDKRRGVALFSGRRSGIGELQKRRLPITTITRLFPCMIDSNAPLSPVNEWTVVASDDGHISGGSSFLFDSVSHSRMTGFVQ
jgi:hypothetical protein